MTRFPFESLVETLSDLWPMADFPEDWIMLVDLDVLRDLRISDRKKWLKRGKAEALLRAIQVRVDEIYEAFEDEDMEMVGVLMRAFPDDLQNFEGVDEDQRELWIARASAAAEGVLNYDEASKVYFVGDGELMKIGVTTNLSSRLRSLRTGNPRSLRIYLTLLGYSDDERRFHKRFAEYRVGGEWFRYTGALRDFVEGMKVERWRS